MPAPSVEVIVPYAPNGCPYREAAWRWLKPRYKRPVRIAEGGEPWRKGVVIGRAISASSADICVIVDADVLVVGLEDSVAAVAAGAPFAVPHYLVHRLSAQGTANVIAGSDWQQQTLAQRPYRGVVGGGCVVAWREVFQSIPPDPRFVGWGQEDESWGWALHALVGKPWRGMADLIHLYHPPQQRMSRRNGNPQNVALCKRYRVAVGKPQKMRALLNEIGGADVDNHADQSPMHGRLTGGQRHAGFVRERG